MQLKNKKILYFITTKSGFCRNNYISAAKTALEEGARVFVLCREDNEDNLYRKAGFRVFLYTKYSLLDIRRIYKMIKPDIVHHIGLGAVIRGSLIAAFVKPKRIFNTFMGRFGVPSGKFQRCLLRMLFKRKNAFLITENAEDRQDALTHKLVDEKRLFMIPGYGIDVEKIKSQPEPEEEITFAMADLIRWDRGVGEYIKAIDILRRDKKIEALFILSGFAESVKASDITNTKLRDWNNGETISWWGYIRDPLKVWSKTHVAVFPAYANGLCVNIAQAAASGKALIVTDVRGNNMFFKHEENALLVPPKDPQALAEAMLRLFTDEALRKKIGKAARALALKELKEGDYLKMQIDLYKEGKIS